MPYCVYCNKYFTLECIESHQDNCVQRPFITRQVHFKSFYKKINLNADVCWPIDNEENDGKER